MHFQSIRGFTLVEMMTVIAIMSFLAVAATVAYSEVRESARDDVRVNDIRQLQTQLRLYAELSGGGIDCGPGFKIDGSTDVEVLAEDTSDSSACPDGGDILSFLEDSLGLVPQDPLGPDNNDYYYYIDPHICDDTDGDQLLLFAVNLEAQESNASEVCNVVGGNNGGYENTTAYGGSISNSVPYVARLPFLFRSD